jgi:nitrite reductase (NO-forming)
VDAVAGTPGPLGAPGRVAEVQRQARPTLVLAAAFLAAAALAGAVPHNTGRWLPLHLALAGGLVLAVSGATQFLAVTWGAAPAPRRGVVALQRWLVAGGAVLVAAGRESALDAVTAAGGVAVAAGLVVLSVVLVGIAAGAVQRRVRPAIVAYLAGLGLGVVGVGLGAVLGAGGGGHLYVRLRDVHETLNLLGLAGFVVAGTLPFFVATQAKTKMSPRASLGAQFGVQAVMAAGLAAAVVGLLGRWHVAAAMGLAVYGGSLVYLVTLLPRLGPKQFRWAGPRLVQAGAAIVWWIGAVGLAAGHAAAGHSPFSGAVVPALVIGGYVQLLAAALSYLGPVLVGGGHPRLAASFRATRSCVGLVAGNVAAVSACTGLARPVYAAALGVWAVDGSVRAGLLVTVRLRLSGAEARVAAEVSDARPAGRRRRR